MEFVDSQVPKCKGPGALDMSVYLLRPGSQNGNPGLCHSADPASSSCRISERSTQGHEGGPGANISIDNGLVTSSVVSLLGYLWFF